MPTRRRWASLVGCSWCLDFNCFEARNKGLDVEKARRFPRWREADAFTALTSWTTPSR